MLTGTVTTFAIFLGSMFVADLLLLKVLGSEVVS